jgi:hypothetical protein
MRFGGPQRRYRRCEEEQKRSPAGNRTPAVQPATCRYAEWASPVLIQSVPGGKVGILGDHSLSKKLYIYMCPIPNGFRDRTVSLYSNCTPYRRATRLTRVCMYVGMNWIQLVWDRIWWRDSVKTYLKRRFHKSKTFLGHDSRSTYQLFKKDPVPYEVVIYFGAYRKYSVLSFFCTLNSVRYSFAVCVLMYSACNETNGHRHFHYLLPASVVT